MRAINPVGISKIRFCGGKVGAAFESMNCHTVEDVQAFSIDKLMNIFHDHHKSKWVYEVVRGICNEEVGEKGAPK